MRTRFKYKTMRAYLAEMLVCVVFMLGFVFLVCFQELYTFFALGFIGLIYTIGFITTKLPTAVGNYVDRRWPPTPREKSANTAIAFINTYCNPNEWDNTPSHARTLPTLQLVHTPEPVYKPTPDIDDEKDE